MSEASVAPPTNTIMNSLDALLAEYENVSAVQRDHSRRIFEGGLALALIAAAAVTFISEETLKDSISLLAPIMPVAIFLWAVLVIQQIFSVWFRAIFLAGLEMRINVLTSAKNTYLSSSMSYESFASGSFWRLGRTFMSIWLIFYVVGGLGIYSPLVWLAATSISEPWNRVCLGVFSALPVLLLIASTLRIIHLKKYRRLLADTFEIDLSRNQYIV